MAPGSKQSTHFLNFLYLWLPCCCLLCFGDNCSYKYTVLSHPLSSKALLVSYTKSGCFGGVLNWLRLMVHVEENSILIGYFSIFNCIGPSRTATPASAISHRIRPPLHTATMDNLTFPFFLTIMRFTLKTLTMT
jgi:hypothetical protein